MLESKMTSLLKVPLNSYNQCCGSFFLSVIVRFGYLITLVFTNLEVIFYIQRFCFTVIIKVVKLPKLRLRRGSQLSFVTCGQAKSFTLPDDLNYFCSAFSLATSCEERIIKKKRYFLSFFLSFVSFLMTVYLNMNIFLL